MEHTGGFTVHLLSLVMFVCLCFYMELLGVCGQKMEMCPPPETVLCRYLCGGMTQHFKYLINILLTATPCALLTLIMSLLSLFPLKEFK